jgi:hypothetical protein
MYNLTKPTVHHLPAGLQALMQSSQPAAEAQAASGLDRRRSSGRHRQRLCDGAFPGSVAQPLRQRRTKTHKDTDNFLSR